jgi:hypothetical protein
VFLYYSAGLVLVALAWDLLRSSRPLPVWTFATVVLLNDAYIAVHDPRARGLMRLVVTVGMVASVLLLHRTPRERSLRTA